MHCSQNPAVAVPLCLLMLFFSTADPLSAPTLDAWSSNFNAIGNALAVDNRKPSRLLFFKSDGLYEVSVSGGSPSRLDYDLVGSREIAFGCFSPSGRYGIASSTREVAGIEIIKKKSYKMALQARVYPLCGEIDNRGRFALLLSDYSVLPGQITASGIDAGAPVKVPTLLKPPTHFGVSSSPDGRILVTIASQIFQATPRVLSGRLKYNNGFVRLDDSACPCTASAWCCRLNSWVLGLVDGSLVGSPAWGNGRQVLAQHSSSVLCITETGQGLACGLADGKISFRQHARPEIGRLVSVLEFDSVDGILLLPESGLVAARQANGWIGVVSAP